MIVVFGSINLDLVARVERLPGAGETIAGHAFSTSPGGKGANQALAARRAGANVAMFGAVGRDAFASSALALLRRDGVQLAGVIDTDAPTGVAMIHVDASGENTITVVAGANALGHAAQVPEALLDVSTTLLLQLETPVDQSLALARRAHANGARVMLNPAPAQRLDADWLGVVDILIVNESESAHLAEALGVPADGQGFALAIAARHGIDVIVTLGARGAFAVVERMRYEVPALQVPCVDTVGAGDAFVGACAAALDNGQPIAAALARGAAAGGLACMKHGAQAALPDADAIRDHAIALESRITVSGTSAQ